MLSIFPNLLTYSLFAPILLRLTIGAIFLFWAYANLRSTTKNTPLIALEALIGLLLILGLFTQPAALLASIILLYRLGHKVKARAFFTDGVNYYFILLVISLSLLVLGPGSYSFDLPL